VCGGFVQKLQWQIPGRRTRSRRATNTPAIRSGGCKTSNATTDCTLAQEDNPFIPQHSRAVTASPATDNIERRQCSDGPDTRLVPILYARQPEYFQLSSSALEQLAFFTWTFSPVTLTYDIKANPWQACIPQIEQAPFLLDAVRALVIRHRSHLEDTCESIAVLELKDKALNSFAQSIRTVPLEVGISVSLILIGIDYAESAFGNWLVHLQGVHEMIEAAGGVRLGNDDMHLRAQIAQLIWYDTIIALLSRRDPVFPREYIEHILSWTNDSQWSLLALNGFPDAAFLYMYDIAEAAAHAPSLSDGYVAALEMKLWLARFETEQGSADKDISALADCWRLGLLLYCTRVFHDGETSRREARVLAEEIMWLVYEIPPESNAQKQALFPLFLAASEMDSFRFRRIAIEFCERWKRRSGLWLNQTARELLETVWAAVDENPEKNIWWGDLVNPSPGFGFLFG
jgi:hypothetical protein